MLHSLARLICAVFFFFPLYNFPPKTHTFFCVLLKQSCPCSPDIKKSPVCFFPLFFLNQPLLFCSSCITSSDSCFPCGISIIVSSIIQLQRRQQNDKNCYRKVMLKDIRRVLFALFCWRQLRRCLS